MLILCRREWRLILAGIIITGTLAFLLTISRPVYASPARRWSVCPGAPATAAGVIRYHANGRESIYQWITRHPGSSLANILSATLVCGPGWQQYRQVTWIDGNLHRPMPQGMWFDSYRN